jgi:hypothetical protein
MKRETNIGGKLLLKGEEISYMAPRKKHADRLRNRPLTFVGRL